MEESAGRMAVTPPEPPMVPTSVDGFSEDWVRHVMEDWFRRQDMNPEDVVVR